MKKNKEKLLASDKDLVVSAFLDGKEVLMVTPGYLRFKNNEGKWIVFPEMINMHETIEFSKKDRKLAQKVVNHYQRWIDGENV